MSKTAHIPQDHPVRMLLRMAVTDKLTPHVMGTHLDAWDEHLPDRGNLSRFRPDVAEAAEKVHALAATGAKGNARRLADETAATIAGRMSEAERAVTGAPEADSDDLSTIGARMFNR